VPDLRFQISGNGEKQAVSGYCAAPDAEFDISDFKERHILKRQIWKIHIQRTPGYPVPECVPPITDAECQRWRLYSSLAMHRSIMTKSPARRARIAEGSFATPSCIQIARAPI